MRKLPLWYKIATLDVGVTTGLFLGIAFAEEPWIRYQGGGNFTIPLTSDIRNSVMRQLNDVDVIVMELPSPNYRSTFASETAKASAYWQSLVTSLDDVPVDYVRPADWKPRVRVDLDYFPEARKERTQPKITQHERDSVFIGYYWARWGRPKWEYNQSFVLRTDDLDEK